ncbi:trypsin-like serine protease [Psychromicrobium sp. YIM B11713]|uniref:trypsin-like serine protease n=1 Tax=Psychromicrobium sp. YIM B11713 TaxID=3145233 RepID=UPI00374F7ED8
MKIAKFFTVAALVGLVTTAALGGVAPAQAAQQPAPEIVGGSKANISAAPYVAQFFIKGQFNCTASLISPTWVLIAKHCTNNVKVADITFRFGNANLGQGTVAKPKRVVQWSSGDIALVELTTSYITTVPNVGKNYPAQGAIGNIYGWGGETANGPLSSSLKTAKVKLLGTDGKVGQGIGESLVVEGVDGQAWTGDSGGPFVVGGVIVGVGSTSDSGGTKKNGLADYASIAPAASWITATSGVRTN